VSPISTINRPSFLTMLFVSAWAGLIAGILEVGAILTRKQFFDADKIPKMSRHFVWMIPLSDMTMIFLLGLTGALIVLVFPRRAAWPFARVLTAVAMLPFALVAFPKIYAIATFAVTLGIAIQIVPRIERHRNAFRKLVLITFPLAVALVSCLAGSFWVSDRMAQSAENQNPLPPPGSPNVLLIVLDTVAAGHVSLNGYQRPTTTTLVELAQHGVQFTNARSASSWTLPSHATMFTGHWLHELFVGWLTPLDRTFPTVAEVVRSAGYATAGFVANTYYCGRDSGLARGFTHYEDQIFPKLTVLKQTVMVKRGLEGLEYVVYYLEDWLRSVGLLSTVEQVWDAIEIDRKSAHEVNRQLLTWLSRRDQPERPFFAFLNFYDAHYPYSLLPTRLHRFGTEPADDYQRTIIRHWWEIDKKTLSLQGIAFAADAYDDCIADLDEQLGILIDQLNRRGILDNTWLIIVSDHGESFGEHPGVFVHGSSLYDTEIHVPLLIIPPGGKPTTKEVNETVTLRDMAATIADIAGLKLEKPFPGEPLTRFWTTPESRAIASTPSPTPALVLSEVAPNKPSERDYWGAPTPLPPLGSLKDSHWSYINRDQGKTEELFRVNEDPREQHNLAEDPALQPTLSRLRGMLDKGTKGPLNLGRFAP
jgi:arylsulfatase A-like enzyme